MNAFEKKDKIQQLIHEFKDYDNEHQDFLVDFENSVYSFLVDNPKCIKLGKDFSEDLKVFSLSLVNCAYEVLDKDSRYSTARMKKELEKIDKLTTNYPSPLKATVFSEGFTRMVKEKMPNYFPALFNLSADGFRFLERSTNYRINAFLMFLHGKL